MYVCLCTGVTQRDILEAIEAGAATVEEVAYCTGAGTRCGTCVRSIAAMIPGAQVPEAASARHPSVEPCSDGPLRLRVLTSAA